MTMTTIEINERLEEAINLLGELVSRVNEYTLTNQQAKVIEGGKLVEEGMIIIASLAYSRYINSIVSTIVN